MKVVPSFCGICALYVLAFSSIQGSAEQSTRTSPASQQTTAAQSGDPSQAGKQAPARAKQFPDKTTLPPDTRAPSKLLRAETPRERAWLILREGITFTNAEKRAKALSALGLLKGNAEAEKWAIEGLEDDKAEVRTSAANALGTMHAVHAKPALEVALDDKEPAVVLAAANSLLLLKDAEFAYDVYYGVLTGTVRTNKGVLKEQVRDQMKILHDKKKVAELGIEQGVGFLPYGGIGYGMVKTLVKSDNSPVRAAAAKKLAHDPDPASGKALVAATQDKNWVVREAALEAIAERGDRSLVRQIEAALDDDKDEVRFTAAACIAHLSAGPAKHRIPATAVAAAVPAN